MSNISKLYWLTRLDYFQGFLITFVFLSLIFTLVVLINAWMDSEWDNNWVKWAKRLPVIAGIVALMICFVPTKNEMIFILVGGKTMDFIQADSSLNKIPGQTTAIITNYLDKALKERH